ncbi:MAG: AarF/UbiB family protein, partial [Oleiphilaceae bacterium]|nr:AarF/UbiB family protein [Oleiphilaceae bacterium]
ATPVNLRYLPPFVLLFHLNNLGVLLPLASLAIELMLISSQYWAPHSKLRPFLSAMAEQIKEFTRGFEQELDFNHEALIQQRFFERSLESPVWYVPRVYESAARVLEMEYLSDAMAINRALDDCPSVMRRDFQRKIASNFLHAMLEHLIIHQEFHGDLHPGNVMVDQYGRLYLIDWGNSVDMEGKWRLLGAYVWAVIAGDVHGLTSTLIQMSTQPEANQKRYDKIHQALSDTLNKKGITPLGRIPVMQLYREGRAGFQARLQTALQLMSNTYQLNITIKSDYLHLSRSLFAMAGTYGNLYQNMSQWTLLRDLLSGTVSFPVRYSLQKLFSGAETLPLVSPEEMQDAMASGPALSKSA